MEISTQQNAVLSSVGVRPTIRNDVSCIQQRLDTASTDRALTAIRFEQLRAKPLLTLATADHCKYKTPRVVDRTRIEVFDNLRNRQRVANIYRANYVEEAVCVADHPAQTKDLILHVGLAARLTHDTNRDAIVAIADEGSIGEFAEWSFARGAFLMISEVPTPTGVDFDVAIFVVTVGHNPNAQGVIPILRLVDSFGPIGQKETGRKLIRPANTLASAQGKPCKSVAMFLGKHWMSARPS